jgi:hypothetical protein
MSGCGNSFGGPAALRPLFVADCGAGTDRVAADLVLLNWESTTNPIYPDDVFEPLDLSAFPIIDGGTLADNAELFKERVRQQITRIYCEYDGPAIRVEHANGALNSEATVVHMTQSMSLLGGTQIGEGEYDRCNRHYDDAAVIFGGEMLELADALTFDEWVMLFANVSAHEIGHTLGFAHVERASWLTHAGRSIYVELMLDGHTLAELTGEQRFVEPQDNCPSIWPGTMSRIEEPTTSCQADR